MAIPAIAPAPNSDFVSVVGFGDGELLGVIIEETAVVAVEEAGDERSELCQWI
jgi:hypothetical protein